MRVNVYNEEFTSDVRLIKKTLQNGQVFRGVRFFLKSHADLHSTPEDDDRSAVTFWSDSIQDLRGLFTLAREETGREGPGA